MTDLHVDEWGDGARVVLVHGSMAAGRETWHDQRPLADDHQLVVLDRRSYGDSPDGDGDFERDAGDVAELLDGGAHLVGNSYGGVVALLAAGLRPESVRSLTVVEPPALGLVRGREAVEEFIGRVDAARREASDGADYARRFITSFGFDEPERRPAGRALRAATASWRERPPWEAAVPLATLEQAPFPMLVVRGAWDVAPPTARRIGRAALHPVCDVLAEHARARTLTVPGTSHAAQRGVVFNDELHAFWEEAS
ncbi:MAG: alpha/beta hydrolase [Actinobacteria bacterium]|nr:MAG: alpha/beta hydrolase [Actinomycetota bacterium]